MRTTKLAMTVLVLALFAGFTSVGTLAVFGDQETAAGNLFQSGTIDLVLGTTSAVVTVPSGMMPGDSVTSALTLAKGSGSGDLKYSIRSTATNDDLAGLKDQLALEIRSVDADVSDGACDDFNGTVAYSGDLDSNGTLIPLVPGVLFSNRTLPSTGETLCFRVALPLSTGDAFKNKATNATFTFSAEQTANNP